LFLPLGVARHKAHEEGVRLPYKEFKVPGFDRPVFLLHNDDWSGMAAIEWWDHTYHRIEIPAAVILMISFRESKQLILDGIELHLATLFHEHEGKKNT
jgi:hypothetical protein